MGVVEVGLRDEDEAAAHGGGKIVDAGGEVFEEVDGGAIHKLVDGVEAKAVDVEVAHPGEGVVKEELADLRGARVLEVHRLAPGGGVLFRGVGSELSGVVADGSEVVVDDVEDDG